MAVSSNAITTIREAVVKVVDTTIISAATIAEEAVDAAITKVIVVETISATIKEMVETRGKDLLKVASKISRSQ